MKKLTLAALLSVVLTLGAFAGDLGNPGTVPPPPCTGEGCPGARNSTDLSFFDEALIWLATQI